MRKNEKKGATISDDEVFIRYPLAYRIQHIVLMLTLIVLLITGLPLLFPESRFFRAIFIFPEMFVLRGQIHRVAALALVVLTIFHAVYTLLSARAREDLKEVIPKPRDISVGIESLRFRLGLRRKRPLGGRFHLHQKLHYWALCTGVAMMILTGFVIWFHDESMMYFPKWVIDLAIILHGYEALLVFLILMIWHIYTVHLTPGNFPMSRVWLTGKITAGKMKELYPGEYEKMVRQRLKKRGDKRTAGD